MYLIINTHNAATIHMGTNYHYINRKVVLFPILNYGPWWDLNFGSLDLQSPGAQSPALPSELLAINYDFSLFLVDKEKLFVSSPVPIVFNE